MPKQNDWFLFKSFNIKTIDKLIPGDYFNELEEFLYNTILYLVTKLILTQNTHFSYLVFYW